MEKCGCHINVDHVTIEYCQLHLAADKMFSLIKKIRTDCLLPKTIHDSVMDIIIEVLEVKK